MKHDKPTCAVDYEILQDRVGTGPVRMTEPEGLHRFKTFVIR